MLEPQLTPKQQVKIQWARPPALLPLSIAAAALFQSLEVLQQLQRRQLRWRTLNAGEQKNGIAVRVLIRGTPDRLGLQKRGATNIPSVGIAPTHKQLAQERSNPTQCGFRRAIRTPQVCPKPNGKSRLQGE